MRMGIFSHNAITIFNQVCSALAFNYTKRGWGRAIHMEDRVESEPYAASNVKCRWKMWNMRNMENYEDRTWN